MNKFGAHEQEGPVSHAEWIRLAGWIGIIGVALYVVEFGLYLATGSRPSFTDSASSPLMFGITPR